MDVKVGTSAHPFLERWACQSGEGRGGTVPLDSGVGLAQVGFVLRNCVHECIWV